MHRKDSTRFMIVFHNNEKTDVKILLDGKVGDSLSWAEDNGFDHIDVAAALRRGVESESGNAGNGTMARPAVAEIVGTRKSPPETLGGSIPQTNKIPGSSLAPRQKEKSSTIPSLNKKKGKLLSKKKFGKETGRGEMTKDMINNFVNPPKVCVVCVISSFINYNLQYCTITNIC